MQEQDLNKIVKDLRLNKLYRHNNPIELTSLTTGEKSTIGFLPQTHFLRHLTDAYPHLFILSKSKLTQFTLDRKHLWSNP